MNFANEDDSTFAAEKSITRNEEIGIMATKKKQSIQATPGDLAPYLFHQGTNFFAYDFLGCSVEKRGDKLLYVFRTYAPSAFSVGTISCGESMAFLTEIRGVAFLGG